MTFVIPLLFVSMNDTKEHHSKVRQTSRIHCTNFNPNTRNFGGFYAVALLGFFQWGGGGARHRRLAFSWGHKFSFVHLVHIKHDDFFFWWW